MSLVVFNEDGTLQDEFPQRGKMIAHASRHLNWRIWADFQAASRAIHSLDNECLLADCMKKKTVIQHDFVYQG